MLLISNPASLFTLPSICTVLLSVNMFTIFLDTVPQCTVSTLVSCHVWAHDVDIESSKLMTKLLIN